MPGGPTNTPICPTSSPLGDVNSEGGSKGHFNAGKPSAGDTTGAGWAAHTKGSEVSPKVSEYVYEDGIAKSGDSIGVARARPH